MPPTTTISETQILRLATEAVRRALPPEWRVDVTREPRLGRGRADAVVTIVAPEGATARFVAETKRSLTPRSLLDAVEQVNRTIETSDTNALPLIAAAYLSPRSKGLLIERGVSYVDSTGNLRLVASRPGLFVETTGATKDPWPDDQPLRSLRGRGAGRAVRALVDFRPPFGVREIASRSKVPPATLSRVIALLERDVVLTTDERGAVLDVDWAAAIRRWSQDYELRRSNTVAGYLDPRGLPAFVDRLGKAKWRYAATSSIAAQRFAPIAPARTAVVYVDDAGQAAEKLKLRAADSGANVLFVEPYDTVVFERSILRDGLVTAAPSQVAADLLTGPGREPSEGEELLDWMKRNRNAWQG